MRYENKNVHGPWLITFCVATECGRDYSNSAEDNMDTVV